MARNGECPPCQMGEHEHHYRVVQAAPEGGFGGVVCNCKGECRDVDPKERLRRMLGFDPDLLRPARAEPGGPGP